MNKKAPDKWIRKAIYDQINNIVVDGVTVPCFDTNVVSDDRPQAYILLSTQSNAVDKSNKCEYFWDSEIQIDINTIYSASGNTGSRLLADNIMDKVRELTDNLTLDVASGLEIFIRNQSFPNGLASNSGSQIIFRKFIRISLKIK